MSAADLGLENIRKDKPVTHHGVSNVNGDGMTKHRPCIGKSVAPPSGHRDRHPAEDQPVRMRRIPVQQSSREPASDPHRSGRAL